MLNSDSIQLLEDSTIYKQSRQRFLQLYLFVCALISNIIFGFALSPIAKELSIIYSVDDKFIQVLIVSFTVFSAAMIIPGNIMSEKFGIESNIKCGCMLTLIGALISLFVKYSFWFLYFGELVSLFGFPFRLISTSKFTASWFYPKVRITITVIIALIFNASVGLSIRIPLWIIGNYNTKVDDANFTNGKALVEDLVYFMAVLIAFLTIPPLLFFKSKPKHPPSYTASDSCPRENYTKAGKALLENNDYLLLALAFPFILGSVLLLTVQMEYIVKPFDYNLQNISDCILYGVIAGLIGDLTVGYLVKSTLKYKLVLRICNALTTFFFGLLIIALFSEVKWFFYACYFMVCGCSSILAVTFEFSCEVSFPVSENSTIAYLGLVGNLMNFLQTIPEIFISQAQTKFNSFVVLFIMLGFISVGNFFTYKVNENLKRLEEDERQLFKESQRLEQQSLKTI